MLVGNLWLFNVIVVLFAAAVSSKQVSGVDNERYSKTPRKMKLNFHILPQERPQDVSKKMLKFILTDKLFQNRNTKKILGQAIDTTFIQLMTAGKLSPMKYSHFIQQDTSYLKNVANVYEKGASKVDRQFAEFYMKQAEKFHKMYQDSLKDTNLLDTNCVNMGTAFPKYMAFHENVMNSNPEYIPIAMLPCSVLWYWITDGVIDKVDKQNNLYYQEWFSKNMRDPNIIGSTEKFVNAHYTKEHEEKASIIFSEALTLELNCFQEAGGEKAFSAD